MGWTGRYTETGVFVCFEGGEGSGKSTQSALLRAWLQEQGYAVLLTFEPGDTIVGREEDGQEDRKEDREEDDEEVLSACRFHYRSSETARPHTRPHTHGRRLPLG